MTAQRIIQQIFQKPELDRVSIVTVEELVEEYPYFTAARLLLAKKNYEQYPSLHSPAVKKAQLYSNNPHYFFQFLTGELEKSAGYAAPPAQEPAPVENQPVQPVNRSWETLTRRESEGEMSFLIREREEIRAAIRQMEALESQQQHTVAEPEREEDSWQPAVGSEQSEENGEAAGDASEIAQDAETEAFEEEITYAEPEQAQPEAAAAQEPEPEPEEEDIAVQEGTVAPVPVAATAEEAEQPTEAPAAAEAQEPAEEEQATFQQDTELTVNQQADAGAEEPIKIFPLEIPEEETTLTFQPLYTDDYFAYKRLKEPGNAEELNEKGAAEMRSFTDWLREMKHSFAKKADKDWYHQQLHRIYVDDDPEVSEAVEKMAMESITLNDDIVSETLAEIWARQRQYQTAIQIYQKLSLLNPNKSAYFAQKIQELQLAQSEANKS